MVSDYRWLTLTVSYIDPNPGTTGRARLAPMPREKDSAELFILTRGYGGVVSNGAIGPRFTELACSGEMT